MTQICRFRRPERCLACASASVTIPLRPNVGFGCFTVSFPPPVWWWVDTRPRQISRFWGLVTAADALWVRSCPRGLSLGGSLARAFGLGRALARSLVRRLGCRRSLGGSLARGRGLGRALARSLGRRRRAFGIFVC